MNAIRLLIIWIACAGTAFAQVVLTGRVVDDKDAPVANARVSVPPAPDTNTGPSGTFHVSLPAAGTYQVMVNHSGFFQLKQPVDVQPGAPEVTLVLNPQREIFQSVTVGAQPESVSPEQTERQQTLTGTEVNDIPYPASHSLRNAMKLIPGVVEDPAGGVHFHGGAENQTRYVLNGFDITDPIDNRFSTRLAVEGVRSMDLTTGRESPQFGGGSAGTLQIQTENGTDKLQYTATNFIPGVDTTGGLHFGDWTPRAGVSGPIVKGRAWFSDSFDGEYNSGIVNGLPSGQNSNSLWAAGNLVHTQVNLAPRDILYADLLTNFDHQSHNGLGVLDPVSTTTALTDHEWMAGVKETHSWTGGAMLETGFAWLEVYHHRSPMGDAFYVLSPEGRSGNYFINSTENGRRAQVFANFYPRALHLRGRHQLQVGADAQRLDYNADFRRTGFQVVGLSGLPTSETTFRGSGIFDRPNAATSAYVNDHWQPRGDLYVDAGVRMEWDELVRQTAVSPRVSVSWAPFADARTKVSAGYSRLHDATNLALFSRPLDQQSVTTFFTNGAPAGTAVSTFALGPNLKFPVYDEWSAGVQHDFGRRITGNFEWMRKRGTDGFVYAAENAAVNLQPLALAYGYGGDYLLTNQRQDRYDEMSFSVRQTFGDGYGWMGSYVRSSAVSNAVLDISVDQPLAVSNNFGPMPWDTPNRFMGWFYLPLPMISPDWAVAALFDWRTGFPFSVVNDAGAVVGPVNSYRYLSTFDLNLAIERRFTFRGYRLALRVGMNNITNHLNPTAVNNVIGAPQFLQFYGYEGRHAQLRIRVLGRVGK